MSDQWTRVAKTYDPIKCGSIDGIGTEVHDKGIIRAVNSRYKPNKGVSGDKYNTLFVGRLNHKTSQEKLHEFFSYYGKIKTIRLVRDIVTGYSKGYAFVEFEDEKSTKEAYKRSHGSLMDGCAIIVDYEHERTLPGWVPRRLGGGFGGKKESGQLRFGCRDRPFKRPLSEQHSHFRRESERTNRSESHLQWHLKKSRR